MRQRGHVTLGVGVALAMFMAWVSLADGVDAGSFARDGAGSRAFGFGGAFVAVADDVSASLWNPAGLLQLDGVNLLGMYTNKFGLDIAFQYVAATTRVQDAAFGVGIVRSSIDDIPYSGDEGEGYFSEIQSLIEGSVAYDVGTLLDIDLEGTLDLFFGANAKVYTHRILEGRGRGLGFDVSVLAKYAMDWGTIGLGYISLDTLGTTIQWSGTDHNPTNDVPWVHKLGVSLRALDGGLLTSADVDLAAGSPELNRFHLGAEYSPIAQLAGRAGLVLSQGDVRWTVGGSIRWLGFALDYAYVPHSALGASHVLSLSYGIPAWWEEDEMEGDVEVVVDDESGG